MLSEFYITTEDFEHELKACGRDLVEWKDVDHIQRHRMSDLGQDMLSFRESFVRAHINATMWVLDQANEASRVLTAPTPKWEDLLVYLSGGGNLPSETKEVIEAHFDVGRQILERMERRRKSRAEILSQESAWELKAAYKAYFFFIRAFQDACYRVLLNITGSKPGKYSSMRRCIEKKVAPIYDKVAAIPGYVDWFGEFKQKRDLIKAGVSFSLCGPQWDVGVIFNKITPEGGIIVDASPIENKFRLGDLVSAFQYSTALLSVIRRDVPRSNNALNADASKAGAN